jgi:hypothetical protein
MSDAPEETVIIVHGTWAAPDWADPKLEEPVKRKWYEFVDGRPGDEPFPAKLDAALRDRSSPARCWAHCTQYDQIFHWSGGNSWIQRTSAASQLGDYVAALQNKGWRCHIVAHSHGGNVAVEALPQITAALSTDEPLGTVITLGTPFMDTMSPILERAERASRILYVVSWIGFGAIAFVALGYIIALPLTNFPLLLLLSLLCAGVWFARAQRTAQVDSWIGFAEIVVLVLSYIVAFPLISFPLLLLLLLWCAGVWFARAQRTAQVDPYRAEQRLPPLFAMGSLMDEPWQVLHHMRAIHNPLAAKTNALSYLFSSLRSNILQNTKVARIRGAKSYRDLGIVAKLVMTITHAATVFVILILFLAVRESLAPGAFKQPEDVLVPVLAVLIPAIVIFIFVLFFTGFFGGAFYSAYFSPFRWFMKRAGSLGGIFSWMTTYMIRDRGWSVFQTMAMGLDGYRFATPLIEQFPRNVPEKLVRYETMPRAAEQRALERRNAWVARHFGNVSQTFSKLAVTTADINVLLRTIEEDQTLVHATYYTDDECIARIADWIAGRG